MIKTIAKAWKWILLLGIYIAGFLSIDIFIVTDSIHFMVFLHWGLVISAICLSVFLHREINLEGHISVLVGFWVGLLTLGLGLVLNYVFKNLMVYGSIFGATEESFVRRYYNSSEPIPFYETFIFKQMTVYLIAIALCWAIALIFKKHPPQ
jgi:hypothetical protein